MHEDELKKNRWLSLQAKVSEEKIKKAFSLFRQSNIEPILIKGWAIAREYPQIYQRSYSDIDLCVPPDLFEQSRRILLSQEARALNIDLHNGLRHLDTFDWDDLFENSKVLSIDGCLVRILRPEDHLRVLCVHWLTDGGAHKEKLLDLYYLIENRRADFDWERCLGKLSDTRRDWIIRTVGLVCKYYRLEPELLPFAGEIEFQPKWLVKTLEKEWASNLPLKPLHTLLGNRIELWEQITKRIPPNAIQATIEMEGKLDESSRLYYQLGSFVLRVIPSVKRVYTALKIKTSVGNTNVE